MSIQKDDWQVADPGKPEGPGGAEMVSRMNNSHRPLRMWAFQYLYWHEGMHILDVGCGGGAAIADMLKLSEQSIVEGIDYSADCVEFSRQFNAAELGKRVFIQKGDVTSLPFPGDIFDLVTCIETVYFWPDLKGGLKEILRVLKSGGQCAVICEVDGPERMDWEKVNFDLTVYTPEQLVKAMEDAGYENIQYKLRGDGYMLVYGVKP